MCVIVKISNDVCHAYATELMYLITSSCNKNNLLMGVIHYRIYHLQSCQMMVIPKEGKSAVFLNYDFLNMALSVIDPD